MSDLASYSVIDVDQFPCGCLITTQDAIIVFANQYFVRNLEWEIDALVGQNMDVLLNKPTQLFCESYVTPTVLNEGQCCEVQVSLLNPDGAPIPKVASVRRTPNGNLVWIFLEAENRTRLFHELDTARQALQEQREQLELLALTDPLTGLSNRRDFHSKGRHILASGRRSGRPVSALMIDVDCFKALNDSYGHDAGDAALCSLADVLKAACRGSDLIARMGGDEFACLLDDTDEVGAKLLCDRIRVALEATGGFGLTVSVGVAEMAGDSEADLHALLKRADAALYVAKRARSDRIQKAVTTDLSYRVAS